MIRLLRQSLLPVLLLLAACAQLPERPELAEVEAVPAAVGGRLDELISPAEASHPGASGFRLLSEGPEAFVVRHRSALAAARSLDVQTYIWHDDLTGLLLAASLLEAADRGVRVRLLLDDVDARSKNYALAALDAHPDIEVRLYNPLASRRGAVTAGLEFLGSFGRLNHRMHNKSWIADNRIAVVGGRNIGDEYFGAGEDVNFIDLDFAMVGPVVRDVSASFDRYWNSPAAFPIAALSPGAVTPEALGRLKERAAPAYEEAKASPYARLLEENDAVRRLLAGDWPMSWTTEYRFVSDDPLKAKQESGLERSAVLTALVDAFAAATQDMAIISPYFVPGQEGSAGLVAHVQAGRTVRILTNSLAANDVAAVHGGYAKYRKRLLRGGVRLYELKPRTGLSAEQSFLGSSGASLHTKALTIDHDVLFVGSFNLDPRSALLNTEQGVMATHPDLNEALRGIFERETSAGRAWQVRLADGDLRWSDGRQEFDEEPLASPGRRFQAWLARILGLESQL